MIVIALACLPAGTLDARGASAVVAKAAAAGAGWRWSSLGTIDANVFGLALSAANCAVRAGAVADPSTLTVIDYSKPSTAKRLWVFAYYPDQEWLNGSRYLGGCAAAH